MSKIYSSQEYPTLIKRNFHLRCINCNHEEYDETIPACSLCQNTLEFSYQDPRFDLPFNHMPFPDPIFNYETPIKYLDRLSSNLGIHLSIKLESTAPTGSFKDRGSHLEVRKAIELEMPGICLASSGNMGASMAFYAKAFKIQCHVFVPVNTNPGKLKQIEYGGAILHVVNGDYSDAELEARSFALNNGFLLAGDYAIRQEGQKSIALEIISQHSNLPDVIIIPLGCGTLYSSIGKGFYEEYLKGNITKIPMLVGVQASGACSLVHSILEGQKVVKSVKTIAQATAVSNPLDYLKVIKYMEMSSGYPLIVSEKILTSAWENQCDNGIFLEPSGLLPLAAVIDNQNLFIGMNVLLIGTGIGFKNLK